ncbi:MAG: aminotransferase class V-fold PLP-dependent enzyme [Chloroflexota bacterium]|jgi:cysteine desulfurase / selenocysteine lyase
MYNLDRLRQEEFINSAEVIYFNNAGIAPLPYRTQQKVQSVIGELGRQPSGFWEKAALPASINLQEKLARHINAASPTEIAFVTTTSAALNAVAQAIDWLPGDNILLCETEFPSNAYPWMSLVRDGVEVRLVPAFNGGMVLKEIESLVDDRTRLIATSSVQFLSGHRTDLTAIGQFCRMRGILFSVDAIQSIGHIPIDVQAMDIDILATGGQKSLPSLPGIGFLYVRQDLAERMNPRQIGSNSTVDFFHWLAYDLAFLPGAARFNSGTPNLPGIFSIEGSLELLNELSLDAIDTHTTALSRYACEHLSSLDFQVVTPDDVCGPIVTFRSPLSNFETDQLVRNLAERQIVVVKHLDAAGNPHLRLSFHCYNTFEEIDRFIEVYESLAN